MTLEEEMRRAGSARQVIDSEIFQEARKYLESQLANLRRGVPLRDTDMHTRLILMEQLSNQFFEFFDQLAQTGRMAELHLEEVRRQQSLVERGLSIFRTGGRNTI